MNLPKDTIVILGPTGSGKTGVAIEVAKDIGGEIISADSRAIYKGLDIGTAKPTPEEQAQVPHWGLDLVEPGERFTVADWKPYAEQKITEIKNRGHVPVIVGGTGLYIDALVYDYQFKGACDSASRELPQLRRGLSESPRNDGRDECPREASVQAPDRQSQRSNFLLIGVKTTPDELRTRITKRVDTMFAQPLYRETEWAVNKYGWDNQAMKSNIYQFAWRYLQGELPLEKAKELAVYDDWHLAKRQLTWFKRNHKICWLPLAKIKPYVLKCIQDE